MSAELPQRAAPAKGNRWGYIVPLLCSGGGILLVGFVLSFWAVIDQYLTITGARAVPAKVLSNRVEEVVHDDSTWYRPVVEFEYTVAENRYTAETVYAISPSWRSGLLRFLVSLMALTAGTISIRSDAEAFIRQYPPNTTVVAYHHPGDPGRAFLIKDYSETPYIFAWIHLLIITLISGALVRVRRSAGPQARTVAPAEALLEVENPLKMRAPSCLVMVAIWFGFGLPLAVHWMSVTESPRLSAVVLGVFIVLPGLIGLAFCPYYWFLERRVADPVVTVRPAQGRLGFALSVFFEQRALTTIRLKELGITLACTEKIKKGDETKYNNLFEKKILTCHGKSYRPFDFILAQADFDIPTTGVKPTGPDVFWKIKVRAYNVLGPDYREEFLVTVTDNPRGDLPVARVT